MNIKNTRNNQRTFTKILSDYKSTTEILLLWLVILVICIWQIAMFFESDDNQSFIFAGLIFGALGGLVSAIRQFRNFVWILESMKPELKERRDNISASNRFFLKPIFLPFEGAIVGLIFSFVFLGLGTSLLRIALLAFIGGYFLGKILDTLGAVFGIDNQQGKIGNILYNISNQYKEIRDRLDEIISLLERK